MKLSEKYLNLNISTEIPDGETWSAYEYEVVDLKHVKKYGYICKLESIIKHGDSKIHESALKELIRIANEENIEYEI